MIMHFIRVSLGLTLYFFLWVASPLVIFFERFYQLAVKIKPIGALLNKIFPAENVLDQLEKDSLKRINDPDVSDNDKLLIKGMRYEYAQAIAPKEKYPSLYVNAPEDLQRSIVRDGRIVNGMAPAVALAGYSLTPEFIEKAWANSAKFSKRVGLTFLIAGLLAAGTLSSIGTLATFVSLRDISQTQPAPLDLNTVAKNYADIWSEEAGENLIAKINSPALSASRAATAKLWIASSITSVLLFIFLTAIAIITSINMGRMLWPLSFRLAIHTAVDESVSPFRGSWREALQRWRWRLPDRDLEMSSYGDQVHFATVIDKSPLIDIGTSLGLLEFRGHLLSPPLDTPIRMSIADLLQHVDVLGGSGEGKSRNFYIPVVRQLLQLRKQGYPIALYTTDDKGAIGADIQRIAQEVGIPESEILFIGTGENDWRVDLLDGLDPIELADTIKSVSKQAGGDGGDDFWPEMASDLLLQVAMVLQTAECTSAGETWVSLNEMRMYSLLNILRVASDDAEIMKVLKIVIDALQDDVQYARISSFDNIGLKASISYLINNWIPMIAATKDGIRANARKALRSFAFKESISKGFADGAGNKLISARELLSNKVKIINIAASEGTAQRMVAIMLKTLLFKQARDAERKNPEFAKERLNWWFNPQPGPEAGKYALNVFLADEYQGLVTSSGNDGTSDATVWNVLRSAGIAGILLSQSVSAYRLAVGDKPTENMRKNWRTKIILRTEDLPTIEEAKKLAGKTMRFQSMDWNHLESTVAIQREKGVSIDDIKPLDWKEWESSLSKFTFWGIMKHTTFNPTFQITKFQFVDYDQPYAFDGRFQINKGLEKLAAEQSATWRQEDKSSGILQHGLSHSDAIQEEDIMQMGRGRALVFVQRAGGTRVEIIKLHG